MTLEDLARKVIAAAESAGAEFMVEGALAAAAYGVTDSTCNLCFLVSPQPTPASTASPAS